MKRLVTEDFGTAREFLSALRPSDRRWLRTDAYAREWLFRGHADASWPLTPATWRRNQPDIDAIIRLLSTMSPATIADFLGCPQPWDVDAQVRELLANPSAYRTLRAKVSNDDLEKRLRALAYHYVAEAVAIRDFVRLADSVGQVAPITRHLYQKLFVHELIERDGDTYEGADWRPFGGVELAQHYGVPTRYLDWTTYPLTAAFFASFDPVTGPSADVARLAVWALRLQTLEGPCEAVHLNIKEYARAHNMNLHAQNGVFTQVIFPSITTVGSHPHFFLEHGRWPLIESDVQGNFELRKLTLPRSELAELRRLLWVEGLSHATLMPGYASVATTVRSLWGVGQFVYCPVSAD